MNAPGPIAASSRPLVEALDVTRSYRIGQRKLTVLRGISLALDAGVQLALCGASGAGKTTLLYILAGLERPDGGSVRIGGVSLYDASPAEQARLRNGKMGYVFQHFYLLPDFTALENVLLPALVGRRSAQSRAEEILEQVGLADRRHHLPAELSGGEQQRVAIARALINDPDILFADEPTGNLDSRTGDAVMDLFLSLARASGKAVLLVTHDEALAARGDQILHLADGALVGTAGSMNPPRREVQSL
ncbi:MAG TPA: ABC transporter ATP-binding protein [Verrucomicrobiales bacterium]|nr:ABC transporter ATP-binding protein [Verrucomicrobiales bacterium]